MLRKLVRREPKDPLKAEIEEMRRVAKEAVKKMGAGKVGKRGRAERLEEELGALPDSLMEGRL